METLSRGPFQDDQTTQHSSPEEVKRGRKLALLFLGIGPDELTTEIIKFLRKNRLAVLVDHFSTIYNTGIIPHDCQESSFIPIQKKVGDHQMISLIVRFKKCFSWQTICKTIGISSSDLEME